LLHLLGNRFFIRRKQGVGSILGGPAAAFLKQATGSWTGNGTDFVVLLSGEPQGASRCDDAVRRLNSLTRALAIACVIRRRLSRVRIPPGEPVRIFFDAIHQRLAGVPSPWTGVPTAPKLIDAMTHDAVFAAAAIRGALTHLACGYSGQSEVSRTTR
jgi:hypothetical protein